MLSVRRNRRVAVLAAGGVAVACGFLGLQAAFPVGAENGCVHKSDGAQYIWHHSEWRWGPIPGTYCVWTDQATGELVSAWAYGPLPADRLTEPYLGPRP